MCLYPGVTLDVPPCVIGGRQTVAQLSFFRLSSRHRNHLLGKRVEGEGCTRPPWTENSIPRRWIGQTGGGAASDVH